MGSPNDPGIGNVSQYLGVPDLGNDPNNSYPTSGMGFGASYSTQQVRYNTTQNSDRGSGFHARDRQARADIRRTGPHGIRRRVDRPQRHGHHL